MSDIISRFEEDLHLAGYAKRGSQSYVASIRRVQRFHQKIDHRPEHGPIFLPGGRESLRGAPYRSGHRGLGPAFRPDSPLSFNAQFPIQALTTRREPTTPRALASRPLLATSEPFPYAAAPRLLEPRIRTEHSHYSTRV